VLLHNRRAQKIAEYSTIEERWRIDPKSLGAEPFRVNSPEIFQQQF
jgi:Uma2 family endonuclease